MSDALPQPSVDDTEWRASRDNGGRRPRSWWSRSKIYIRRLHLYAGLFLLPWVFLYGITGAMFNHLGLFPEAEIRDLSADAISESALASLPEPEALADDVIEALRATAPDSEFERLTEQPPQLTNDISFELHADGHRHAVFINPVDKTSRVFRHPKKKEQLEPLLPEIRNVDITPDPQVIAREAVDDIMLAAGYEMGSSPRPLGWSKLNFLATVDGDPARITYVLRDGHIDITRFAGEDGMSPRQFFLRLHTSHGQPPHWNGRRIWSLFVDAMAIAMVTWGLTGLFMWWQIKRTRLVGGIVILCSLATAGWVYFSMLHFYATTRL